MNQLEKRMVDRLLDLKENHHVIGVKAEFEAEGTRIEEAMRLKEVSLKAGLGLTLKIGGCEACRDMYEAKDLGSVHMVAPMVETPYALKKYLAAVRLAISEDEREDMSFLINLETITACNNFEEMLKLPDIGLLDGVVLGRVDLTGSMNLSREDINSEQVRQLCLKMAAIAKAHGKHVIVGGGVSADSIPFFRSFPEGHLTRFETRKVVFSCPGALDNTKDAFLKAVEFELMWLKNKRAYYTQISKEDDARINLMEQRYLKSIESVTGTKP